MPVLPVTCKNHLLSLVLATGRNPIQNEYSSAGGKDIRVYGLPAAVDERACLRRRTRRRKYSTAI
jgi:hypothetical protein